jgi:hypothetical protein
MTRLAYQALAADADKRLSTVSTVFLGGADEPG